MKSLEKFREQWQRQILSADLPESALRVSIAISWHLSRKQDGWAWPSIATLAKLTGLHARTVIRAIKLLEALGHLEVRRSANLANRYRPIVQRSEMSLASDKAAPPPNGKAVSPPLGRAVSPEPLNEPLIEPLNKPLPNGKQKDVCEPKQTSGDVRTGEGLRFENYLSTIGSDRPPTSKYHRSVSLSEACDRLLASMGPRPHE